MLRSPWFLQVDSFPDRNISWELSSKGLLFPHLLLLLPPITSTMSTTATTTVQEPITAANVIHLFPDVQSSYPPSHRSQSASTTDNDLAGYDEEQIRLMDEVCIVLDNDDNPIGSASKKTCMYTQGFRPPLPLLPCISAYSFPSQATS